MISRYIHHEEITNVVGYVVNVHDAVNYDIDLILPDELVKRYQNVITNQYTYTREVDSKSEEVTGMTFRCRLKGIGINARQSEMARRRPNRKMSSPALREATISMIRQFDRFNGWVICTISDVDVYRRLLVTLYDPVSKRDLREILFADPTGSFSPYLIDSPNNDQDLQDLQDELSSDSSGSSECSSTWNICLTEDHETEMLSNNVV